MKLQTSVPHLCVWDYHGADPSRRRAEASKGQGGQPRKPSWLYYEEIVPEQYGFL